MDLESKQREYLVNISSGGFGLSLFSDYSGGIININWSFTESSFYNFIGAEGFKIYSGAQGAQ